MQNELNTPKSGILLLSYTRRHCQSLVPQLLAPKAVYSYWFEIFAFAQDSNYVQATNCCYALLNACKPSRRPY